LSFIRTSCLISNPEARFVGVVNIGFLTSVDSLFFSFKLANVIGGEAPKDEHGNDLNLEAAEREEMSDPEEKMNLDTPIKQEKIPEKEEVREEVKEKVNEEVEVREKVVLMEDVLVH